MKVIKIEKAGGSVGKAAVEKYYRLFVDSGENLDDKPDWDHFRYEAVSRLDLINNISGESLEEALGKVYSDTDEHGFGDSYWWMPTAENRFMFDLQVFVSFIKSTICRQVDARAEEIRQRFSRVHG